MLGLGMIILGFWHYFGCVEFETLEQSWCRDRELEIMTLFSVVTGIYHLTCTTILLNKSCLLLFVTIFFSC
jgi:hypothetical protein